MNEIAFVTVVSRNHLHFAVALARSLAKHHPDAPLFVCLVDGPLELSAVVKDRFRIVNAEELAIPDWRRFAFQYDAFELACALKPFALEFVREAGYEKIFYLDADMQIYGSLNGIAKHLDTYDVVLTPHLLHPLPEDGRKPDNQGIRSAGIYNAGFLAVNGRGAAPMIGWWKRLLARECIVDVARGVFVDQKWLDNVPALFERVLVMRDPGCNVAYWNLPNRALDRDANGRLTVNGRPLTLYHFSGWDPRNPSLLSRHQNRIALRRCRVLRQLVDEYHSLLNHSGRAEFESWEYRHARLDNGVHISLLWREAVRSGHPLLAGIEDPFNSVATPDLVDRLSAAERCCRNNRDWQRSRWRLLRLGAMVRRMFGRAA